ncbi:MAG: VOC family protein [Nocardioidaceae bacterium]
MAGRVVHFEIPFDDRARAGRFYREAFEWTFQDIEELDYVLATTGPSDQGPPGEPGFINGGMMARGGPLRSPVVTIDVADIEATLRTVERLGGARLTDRQAVGEMGFAAYFTDSEGNVMGLWQNA